jgi:hypothetical protein
MGRVCTICKYQEHEKLDLHFGEYVTLAELAQQTGFRKAALARHRQHVGGAPSTRGRGQICTVCKHPERTAIELALQADHALAKTARQFGLGRDALRRHRQFHLPPAVSDLPALAENLEQLSLNETNRAPAEADSLETEQTAQEEAPADYEAVLGYWRNRNWLGATREMLLEHAPQLSETQVDKVLAQAIQQGELTAYREYYLPTDSLVERLRAMESAAQTRPRRRGILTLRRSGERYSA